MNKGFTLIELLAVIVILAIIALIATPIVLGIINDSKESSIMRSAEFYVDAVKNAIMKENMKLGGTLNPSECIIDNNGNATCDGTYLEIEVDGEKPSGGSITFNEGKATGVNLTFGEKKVILNQKGEFAYDTSKLLKEIAVVSTEFGISSVDGCALGGICESGTPFAIKVNNTETYKFYVLNDNGREVTMIMDRNLLDDTLWYYDKLEIREDPDIDGQGTYYSWPYCEGNNSHGPLMALTELQEATKDWDNLPLMKLSTYEASRSDIYPMDKTFVMHARLPKYFEILISGEIMDLLDYTQGHYWTSTIDVFGGFGVSHAEGDFVIAYGNELGKEEMDYYDQCLTSGIRPVIVLYK